MENVVKVLDHDGEQDHQEQGANDCRHFIADNSFDTCFGHAMIERIFSVTLVLLYQ